MSDISTLYIHHLNEKIPVKKLESRILAELKAGNWDPPVSVIAKKNLKMKGQAFAAFSSKKSCVDCLEYFKEKLKDNKYEFVESRPEFELAKSDSDAALEAKLGKNEYEEHVKQRIEAKEAREKAKLKAKEASTRSGEKRHAEQDQDGLPIRPVKKPKREHLPPNKVLLMLNLPKDISESEILSIYGQEPGFVEIRLVAPRRVCFVEFENEKDSAAALEKVGGEFTMKSEQVSVNFAK